MIYGRMEDDEMPTAALSPAYNARDLQFIDQSETKSFVALAKELSKADFNTTTAFQCPVIFFVRDHDATTPGQLVDSWFRRITAPRKLLFHFKQSAHYVVNEEPGLVFLRLANEVRSFDQELAH